MNVDLMEFFYKLIGIGVVWLVIMGSLHFLYPNTDERKDSDK